MIRIAVAILFAARLSSFESAMPTQEQQDICQDEWQYSTNPDDITGKVVFHETTDELCGVTPTASVTLVKTTGNDTVRVLELCNYGKEFTIGEAVVVHPIATSELINIYVPVDPRACSLNRTCIGMIESIARR
jgi:hypothetical protein